MRWSMQGPSGSSRRSRREGPLVGRVIVGVEHELLVSHGLEQRSQKLRHALLDRLGVGSPHGELQLCAPLLLSFGHAAFAPQGAVGEVVEEPRRSPGGDIDMEREVLGVLESFEAIGDEGFLEAEVVPQVVVEEEAMAAQAGGIAGDGGVGGRCRA